MSTTTILRDLTDIAVFDTETTGTDLEQARIVTAFIGTMNREGAIVDSQEWLLNPGIDIPDEAAAIHGVPTAKAVADGQNAAEGVQQIKQKLDDILRSGIPVVAYNARFDFTVLDRDCRRNGVQPLLEHEIRPVIDPWVIDRARDKWRKGSRTLQATTAWYGVELVDAHNAEGDAVATGRLAQAILALLPQGASLDAVHDRQILRAKEQAESLQTYLRRTNPSAYVEPAWPLKPFLSGS